MTILYLQMDNKNAILPEDMKTLAEFANNYKNMSINRGLDFYKNGNGYFQKFLEDSSNK